MSEFKGTPGPWTVSDKKANGTKAYVDGSTGYIIAQSYCSPLQNVKYKDTWAEAEANAQLISAAPELLKALEDCVFLLETQFPNPAPNGQINRARAAIAKALGVA